MRFNVNQNSYINLQIEILKLFTSFKYLELTMTIKHGVMDVEVFH